MRQVTAKGPRRRRTNKSTVSIYVEKEVLPREKILSSVYPILIYVRAHSNRNRVWKRLNRQAADQEARLRKLTCFLYDLLK